MCRIKTWVVYSWMCCRPLDSELNDSPKSLGSWIISRDLFLICPIIRWKFNENAGFVILERGWVQMNCGVVIHALQVDVLLFMCQTSTVNGVPHCRWFEASILPHLCVRWVTSFPIECVQWPISLLSALASSGPRGIWGFKKARG